MPAQPKQYDVSLIVHLIISVEIYPIRTDPVGAVRLRVHQADQIECYRYAITELWSRASAGSNL